MEMKEIEKVIITRPVASRPSFSSFRTFTELLTKSVNVSPQKSCNETVVSAMKPKTVRFRQTGNGVASHAIARPRVEVSVDGNGKPRRKGEFSDDCSTTMESRSYYIVYKPKAKVVSKAMISVLANMLQGKISVECRGPLKRSEASTQNSSHRCLNPIQKVPTFAEAEAEANATRDRSCLDGYNWRKYGQKHVKGSEWPSSYHYKCTHPKCPVKKKVERSLNGEVSEIVYQGEHNHPKPCLPPRRSITSSASHKLGLASEGRVESGKWVGVSVPSELSAPRAANSSDGTSSDSCCRSGDCDEENKGLDGELDEPKSKKRKNEHQTGEAGVSVDGSGEPRGQRQGSVDSGDLEDGFRWRKYGQKVVGGNPFPRSYYRSTSPNCRARKHVERGASDDPRAFITTYKVNTTIKTPSGLPPHFPSAAP